MGDEIYCIKSMVFIPVIHSYNKHFGEQQMFWIEQHLYPGVLFLVYYNSGFVLLKLLAATDKFVICLVVSTAAADIHG